MKSLVNGGRRAIEGQSPVNRKGGELQVIERFGSSGRTRTYNPSVNSRMLYQLSY
jgi:hypothetical protein